MQLAIIGKNSVAKSRFRDQLGHVLISSLGVHMGVMVLSQYVIRLTITSFIITNLIMHLGQKLWY